MASGIACRKCTSARSSWNFGMLTIAGRIGSIGLEEAQKSASNDALFVYRQVQATGPAVPGWRVLVRAGGRRPQLAVSRQAVRDTDVASGCRGVFPAPVPSHGSCGSSARGSRCSTGHHPSGPCRRDPIPTGCCGRRPSPSHGGCRPTGRCSRDHGYCQNSSCCPARGCCRPKGCCRRPTGLCSTGCCCHPSRGCHSMGRYSTGRCSKGRCPLAPSYYRVASRYLPTSWRLRQWRQTTLWQLQPQTALFYIASCMVLDW